MFGAFEHLNFGFVSYFGFRASNLNYSRGSEEKGE